MDKYFIEKLEESFRIEDYKTIYINILKLFNILKELEEKEELILETLNILNKYKNDLIFGEKQKILNESMAHIYKNIEITSRTYEKDHYFFKKQINDLITREISQFLLLLNNNKYVEKIIDLLSFFYNHLLVEVKKQFKLLLKHYLRKNISSNQVKRLFNPLFDRFPMETLNLSIETIEKKINGNISNENNNPIKLLLEILADYSEIYPDLYYKKINIFFKAIEFNIGEGSSLYLAQIMHNIIKNHPSLFISEFFYILEILSNNINIFSEKTKYFFVISLKTILLNNSFSLFEYFKNELKENFGIFFNIMIPNVNQINDIVYEFSIEYFIYIKTFHYNGKISSGLLELYINILDYFLHNNLSSEYFLLSIITQLNMPIINNGLKIKCNKKELENQYKNVISEMKEYIKIIFLK